MFSAKKLLIIGFIAIILIAIPVTVYLLQQQQEVRSRAQAATKLEFIPTSSPSNPIQAKVGDPVDLDIYVDPSSNLVSFVKLEIQYDSTKLATASGETPTFENNNVAFPSPRGDPDYSVEGKVILSVSVGPLPTSAVKTRTKVGTLHFVAKERTDTPTQVIFGLESQVLSVASTDQASENVLVQSALQPAIINITADETPTETPTPTIDEPTPTEPTITPTTASNKVPVCTLFTATPSSGSAPLDVAFSVSGDDEDGSIDKFAFNFGDNNVTTITADTTNSSNSAQTSHTYTSGGVFTASAVLTDNAGGTSVNTCSQTITIAGPSATPSATIAVTATPTTTLGVDTPTPTLESPGPGATIIGLGAFFTVLSVIGAVLFFAI